MYTVISEYYLTLLVTLILPCFHKKISDVSKLHKSSVEKTKGSTTRNGIYTLKRKEK